MRSAITDKLFDEGDCENRTALFEAHQAVGYALLHLERVEFLIDADLRKAANLMKGDRLPLDK